MNRENYRLKFGLDVRRGISGANLYVKVFQLISLLPLPYIFMISVYPGITASRNVFSVLFDLGMAASPRIEIFALSYVYRMTASECLVYFALPVIALILGLSAGSILTGNPDKSLLFHRFIMVMIIADLVLRLIPIHASIAFGLPAQIIGFIIRSICLYLVIRDMRVGTEQ